MKRLVKEILRDVSELVIPEKEVRSSDFEVISDGKVDCWEAFKRATKEVILVVRDCRSQRLLSCGFVSF